MTEDTALLGQGTEVAPQYLFNPAAEDIPEAISIRFNQIVYELQRAGRDVTVLSLGEAFFDLPLFDFTKLNYVKGYHYSDSQGLPELRQKIAAHYARYGVTADPDTEILISAGSKALLYMCLLATLQPGEEVVVHEPCWLSYPHQARLCGAKTRYIPYHVPVKEFASFLTARTRVCILNNPNNPAGRLYSREELETIYGACVHRGIYLVVDEAYSDFILDQPFPSAGTLSEERNHLIVVNSLSKNMGMSGWRIGYMIANPEVLRVILKINQHLITCAPTILQQYCSTYFDDILAHTLPQVRAVVEKRNRVSEKLDALGLQRVAGGSTFYFFLSLENYPGSSMEFSTELLRKHAVATVPGSAYGKSTDRFVRVSIGTEPMERIEAALERIREMIRGTRTSGVVFSSEDALDERPES